MARERVASRRAGDGEGVLLRLRKLGDAEEHVVAALRGGGEGRCEATLICRESTRVSYGKQKQPSLTDLPLEAGDLERELRDLFTSGSSHRCRHERDLFSGPEHVAVHLIHEPQTQRDAAQHL